MLAKGRAAVYVYSTPEELSSDMFYERRFSVREDHTIININVNDNIKPIMGVWVECYGVFVATLYLSGEEYFTKPIYDQKYLKGDHNENQNNRQQTGRTDL